MHGFFRSTNFTILRNYNDSFKVGVLFLNKEIEELKAEGRWENNLKLKDILLEKISPIAVGFSEDVKVLVALDSSLILRKIEFDEEFLKQVVANGEFNKLQELIVQAINMSTKIIIKGIQQNLENHDVSMKDFIDRIALNHDKKELWMTWHSTDENGNEVGFYAPHGETSLSGLEELGKYN